VPTSVEAPLAERVAAFAQGALDASVEHLRGLGLALPEAALLDEGAAARLPAAPVAIARELLRA
jgi:hypothetical protein